MVSETKDKAAHVWERDALDWYVEPERVTRQLLSVERFTGPIWDPSCGGGNIVRTLISAGYDAFGTDIERRVPDAPWFKFTYDFLSEERPALDLAPNICMNPPIYRAKGAEAFIRRALALAEGKVCAFLDIRFLAGAARAEGVFAQHPPSRVWIVTPRASCPPGAYLAAGNTAGNGSSDWCWMVWDRTSPTSSTSLGWLTAGDGEP